MDHAVRVCVHAVQYHVVEISEAFAAAVGDYVMLLDRGYPERSTRTLVADRFRLNRTERAVLFRGISSRADSARREQKRCSADQFWVGPLRIDALNVVYTIAAYCLGLPVFVSSDGWVRDALEIHGKELSPQATERAVIILTGVVLSRDPRPREVTFLLDQAADAAGVIAGHIGRVTEERGISRVRVLCRSDVDGTLARARTGVIATSDTRVIERCKRPVGDLARIALESRFGNKFVDLRLLM